MHIYIACRIAVKKSRSVSGSEKEARDKSINKVAGTKNVSYGSLRRDMAVSGLQDEKMDSEPIYEETDM